MKKDIYEPIDRIDIIASNLNVTLDTISIILDNLSSAATTAEKNGEYAKSLFFRNDYKSFSAMIYLLLTQGGEMVSEISALAEQIWTLREKQEART